MCHERWKRQMRPYRSVVIPKMEYGLCVWYSSPVFSNGAGPAQTPAQTPKRSRRACRAPTAPDKTPPPPPPPAQTKTRRQRQPAPPAEPVPAPPVDPAPIPAGPEGPPVEPDRVGDSNGHAATRPHDIFDDDNPSVFRLRHTFHGLPYRQDKPPDRGDKCVTMRDITRRITSSARVGSGDKTA
ncbi:hypothetical protein B0H13DRAFT_2302259 [Mycena leptocephala]|nr:hypothetical protein B0H13DRAFT_2302259 [Mycena leptocephala]